MLTYFQKETVDHMATVMAICQDMAREAGSRDLLDQTENVRLAYVEYAMQRDNGRVGNWERIRKIIRGLYRNFEAAGLEPPIISLRDLQLT